MFVGAGDGLTVVVAGLGVVAVAVAVAVVVVVVVECAEELAEALAERPPVAVEVAVPDVDDDADDDPDGEKMAGTLDDGEPVQADTAAETRTIKVAQDRTASRGLPAVLAEVTRTFMKPP